MKWKPIQCASCGKMNPSSVCYLCRQYIKAFLKAGFDPVLTVAYVKLRRTDIEKVRKRFNYSTPAAKYNS